jgi:hypothetical protein
VQQRRQQNSISLQGMSVQPCWFADHPGEVSRTCFLRFVGYLAACFLRFGVYLAALLRTHPALVTFSLVTLISSPVLRW